MRELFVYYRVCVGHETIALNVVNTFQTQLAQQIPRLSASLLCRSQASGAAQTWMEIYFVDPSAGAEGITTELQQAIESAAQALAPHLEGTRHTEAFIRVQRAGSGT